MLSILKILAVLAAAAIVGQSFVGELKKARALSLPWYRPYLSLPGIIIILAILSPIFIKLLKY